MQQALAEEVLFEHDIFYHEAYQRSARWYLITEAGLTTPAAVQLKDMIHLHRDEELMKGFCGKKYARARIQRFCGYYKYYNNNPQLFMKPANQVLREYVQRKKMILYRYIMSKEDS